MNSSLKIESALIKQEGDAIAASQGKGFFSWQDSNELAQNVLNLLLPCYESEGEEEMEVVGINS